MFGAKKRRIRGTRRRGCVESLEPRRLLAGNTFTIAALPDTQHYSESLPEYFNAQTNWIVAHQSSDNIVFVAHEGDIVEDGGTGADHNAVQWQRADAAIAILDGVLSTNPDGIVPYSMAIGNRDYTVPNSHTVANEYTQYFGSARYAGRSWYLGSSPDQLNHAQIFTAGPFQMLHLTLEWEARDNALSWAQGILNSHPNLPAIVTTHSYLRQGGRSTVPETPDGRAGEQLFQDFIKPNPQIFMVLAGHVQGEYRQTSLNDFGREVFEISADYQGRPNGGDGWMRLLRFLPDENRIDVVTYSPTLNQFETDSNSQFSFNINFASRFDFTFPPTATLTMPADNGPNDQDPVPGTVWVAQSPPNLQVQLADYRGGIDDATVTANAIQFRRDGVLLTADTDYVFAYDATSDRITLSPLAGVFNDAKYEISIVAGGSPIRDQEGHAVVPADFRVIIGDPLELLSFSADVQISLPGGLVAENEDVVLYDGRGFVLHFDGSDVGLSSARADAAVFLSNTELLLSFSATRTIPGIVDPVQPADIVRFTATQWGPDTAGSFDLFFRGTNVGLDTSNENIDALALLPDGRLLISTSGAVTVPGVTGADEDVLVFTPTSLGTATNGTWAMYFDGSDVGVGSADVDGVAVRSSGQLILSMQGSVTVGGVTFEDEDAVVFVPVTLGANTTGSWQSVPYFDGSQFGLTAADISSIGLRVLEGPPPINLSPSVALTNTTTTLAEDANTTNRIAVATIQVTDDGEGTNLLSLSGPDASVFQIDAGLLYLKAGTVLNFQSNPLLEVTVEVDDAAVGGSPDGQASLAITITDVNVPATVTLTNTTTALAEDTDTTNRIVVATIQVADDGDGTNVLSLSGPDSALFQIDTGVLYLKAGTALNAQVNPLLEVTVEVDDVTVGGTPDSTANLAISVTSPTVLYFAISAQATLPGGIVAENEDIISFNGSQFSTYFDGSDVGLASGSIDAFSIISDSEILLSFSSARTIAGITGTVDPADLVKFTATQLGANTAGAFTLHFDGSDAGLDTTDENIDAVDLLANGQLLISTTGKSTVSGVSGADEDVLVFTPTTLGADTAGSWAMYFDGSDVGMSSADVDGATLGDNGHLYLSFQDNLTVGGTTFADEDVAVFVPLTLGANTTGSVDAVPLFDGSQFGLTAVDLVAIEIRKVSSPSMAASSQLLGSAEKLGGTSGVLDLRTLSTSSDTTSVPAVAALVTSPRKSEFSMQDRPASSSAIDTPQPSAARELDSSLVDDVFAAWIRQGELASELADATTF